MNALEFVLGFIICVVIWFFIGLIGLVVLAIIITLLYAMPTAHKDVNDSEMDPFFSKGHIERMLMEGYIFDIKTNKWIKGKED
jgi:ABC-type multidrug transport system fused ATPase/permease subunit